MTVNTTTASVATPAATAAAMGMMSLRDTEEWEEEGGEGEGVGLWLVELAGGVGERVGVLAPDADRRTVDTEG